MPAIIHCIGITNLEWEQSIEEYCEKIGIDISWFINLENYRPTAIPDFIIWRAAKFSRENLVAIKKRVPKIISPIVVFSYIDRKRMPIIYKRVTKISFENQVSAFFTLSYDLNEFHGQLKEIDKILKLRWF